MLFRSNYTYVQQTVAGAKAAVDYLTQHGIADGNFGVGGHSYGSFTTANLLAHSDLFKAGVARSGAFNRTLTPFGFQNERRTYWEAPEVYLKMMPFNAADSINEPILLIHGMVDDNSGTFPIQSERMYMALKGLGATVEYGEAKPGAVAQQASIDYELQADCLAGVWISTVVPPGELSQPAMAAAQDTAMLMHGGEGAVSADTHGTLPQRQSAFWTGFTTGRASRCTFR